MAEMRLAAEMKDSGIEWIGSIPQNWMLARLKDVKAPTRYSIVDGPFGSAISTDDYADEGVPLIRITNLVNGEVSFKDMVFIPLTLAETLQRSQTGLHDIIIAKTGGTVGKCAINNTVEDGILSSSCVKVTISDEHDYRYFYYLFSTPSFVEALINACTGTTRNTINLKPLSSLNCTVPSLSEQHAIADYLDDRCSKIDEIIAEATASIEEYKELRKAVITETVTRGIDGINALKNSGYDWMGHIPIDWNIASLKHISIKTISYGVIKLFDPDDDGVYILRCSDVKAGFIDTTNIRTITKELSDEYKRTLLTENDIVINVRGTLGGCAVIPKEMEGYNIAREVALISPDRAKYDSEFIMYFLLSDVFERFRDASLSGAIYVGINMETLSHFRVAYPALDEQKRIAKYLNKKVSDIDTIISEKQSLISDLQAYKKSLIYEVVTGKRRVV